MLRRAESLLTSTMLLKWPGDGDQSALYRGSDPPDFSWRTLITLWELVAMAFTRLGRIEVLHGRIAMAGIVIFLIVQALSAKSFL